MTDDLSALPEDVREAYAVLDAEVSPSGRVSYEAYRAWCTITAELLRLTRENDEWQTRCLQFQTERDKARAELAALKARIAEAPVASVRVDDRMHVSIGARSNAVDFVPLHTKHVALVKVEE